MTNSLHKMMIEQSVVTALCSAVRTRSIGMEAARRTIKSAGRRAAVLAPLADVAGQPSLIFTVRTHRLSTHKGEVAFPGGHIDAGETAVQAACRETYEEIGVSAEGFGQGSDVFAINGTAVTPVLGCIPQPLPSLAHLRPNPDEVASVFSLPVAHLLLACSRQEYIQPLKEVAPGTQHPRGGMRLHAFTGGPERIWGLTAYVLDCFLRDVISPAVWHDLTPGQRLTMGLPAQWSDAYTPLPAPGGKASQNIKVVAAAEAMGAS